MALQGELEHFPLVDIIQLIHVNKKTGILYLKSSKGESHLVFHDGFFASANHLNGNVRIGEVLVGMGAICDGTLKAALLAQEMAGKRRKPLIATMIEQGIIDSDTAFNGLEKLIEMTLVELFTWKEGSFVFDATTRHIPDEYKYFPEKLHMGILLNVQYTLMESLRIYDEKMNDKMPDNPPREEQSEPEKKVLDFFITENASNCLETLGTLNRRVDEIFNSQNISIRKNSGNIDRSDEEIALSHREELVNYISTISN